MLGGGGRLEPDFCPTARVNCRVRFFFESLYESWSACAQPKKSMQIRPVQVTCRACTGRTGSRVCGRPHAAAWLAAARQPPRQTRAGSGAGGARSSRKLCGGSWVAASSCSRTQLRAVAARTRVSRLTPRLVACGSAGVEPRTGGSVTRCSRQRAGRLCEQLHGGSCDGLAAHGYAVLVGMALGIACGPAMPGCAGRAEAAASDRNGDAAVPVRVARGAASAACWQQARRNSAAARRTCARCALTPQLGGAGRMRTVRAADLRSGASCAAGLPTARCRA